MSVNDFPAFAVIADAHFHDMESNYDGAATTLTSRKLTLRSWSDSRRSSRVFNESGRALRSSLEDIHSRGIRHVLLLGDYSDDGQIESTSRLVRLLREHQDNYGLVFYALPGNHDFYGPHGKHQSTRFSISPQRDVLVTSDAEVAATEQDTAILTRKMYCEGAPAALLPMAEFGLTRQADYLHWETPFGQSDAPESRIYVAKSADGSVTHRLMDASYLVEPVAGLWLLMIDANVFEPRNGRTNPRQKKAFLDSSDAGWNAVLREKPFLMEWITDVCSRARLLGKQVIACSHYPIADLFDDHSGSESRLFGNNENVRRKPTAKVAHALSAAGVSLHFGGHLHVNGTTRTTTETGEITDVAVPSLVAFPPGYKIVRPVKNKAEIETVCLQSMPVDSWLMDVYRAEVSATDHRMDPALEAISYGDFLYARMRSRVTHHYLPREWPAEIAGEIVNRNAADLAYLLLSQQTETAMTGLCKTLDSVPTPLSAKLASIVRKYNVTVAELLSYSMASLIADWYCLRHAGNTVCLFIAPGKLKILTLLSKEFGSLSPPEMNASATFYTVFFGIIENQVNTAQQKISMTETVFLPT